MAVILQPCGNKDARAHYNDTVLFPVPHHTVSNLLNEQDNETLKNIYPDGMLKIWGVTPVNQRKWEKVEAGDITLFLAALAKSEQQWKSTSVILHLLEAFFVNGVALLSTV